MLTNTPDTPTPVPEDFPLPLEPQEPPMRLYVCSAPPSSASPPRPCPGPDRDLAPTVTRISEQLSAQNQLLIDLLAAVNGLTAAILCRKHDL